jgi:ubiquinone/menaquinone biosynthesis C-methylase UbiE
MPQVFDNLAGKFARDIDSMISSGKYVRGELFVELTTRMLPPGADIVDFGCGPGRISGLLADQGFRVRGLDTSPGMIEQARKLIKPDSSLSFDVIGDSAETLPASSATAIVCSSVIEYVQDADTLLRMFRMALRADGLLFVSFANSTSYVRKQWERDKANNPMGSCQYHVWNWPEFRAQLERNGFEARSQPLYFESPWDAYGWGKWLRRSAHVGPLGVVAAGVKGTGA